MEAHGGGVSGDESTRLRAYLSRRRARARVVHVASQPRELPLVLGELLAGARLASTGFARSQGWGEGRVGVRLGCEGARVRARVRAGVTVAASAGFGLGRAWASR
eukprot:1383513-Prymnesium_polylepis.1